MVLCAGRRSGSTYCQTPFWILAFACMVALNYQNTSQNACYGGEKRRKSNPFQFFYDARKFRRQCVNMIDNMKSYLFFNVRKFRMKFLDSVCNDLKTCQYIL